MRYFFLIIILFCFQSCSQQTADKDYKLTDNYASVRSRIIAINESDHSLKQRQSATFSLLNKFIGTYPLSVNCLVLLSSAKNLTASQYDSLYKNLNPALREDPYWTSVDVTKSQIAEAETGKSFPEIMLTDTLNKTINTNSFKGKILFLDFWSSWCISCREQFPHLKQIYANYHSKGLEVIGISMDMEKQAWIDALKIDSLPWPQYCEFKPFQENSLAKRFHIMGIPTNFLIDKDGILIGQDLSPNELEILLPRLLF